MHTLDDSLSTYWMVYVSKIIPPKNDLNTYNFDSLILPQIVQFFLWYDNKQTGDIIRIGVRNGDEDGESVTNMVLPFLWPDWINPWGIRIHELNTTIETNTIQSGINNSRLKKSKEWVKSNLREAISVLTSLLCCLWMKMKNCIRLSE